jgi:hypothetical protein
MYVRSTMGPIGRVNAAYKLFTVKLFMKELTTNMIRTRVRSFVVRYVSPLEEVTTKLGKYYDMPHRQ